jgi:hypothetical protein
MWENSPLPFCIIHLHPIFSFIAWRKWQQNPPKHWHHSEFHTTRAQKTTRIVLNHSFRSYIKCGINIALGMLIQRKIQSVNFCKKTKLVGQKPSNKNNFLYLLTLHSLGYTSTSFSYLLNLQVMVRTILSPLSAVCNGISRLLPFWIWRHVFWYTLSRLGVSVTNNNGFWIWWLCLLSHLYNKNQS